MTFNSQRVHKDYYVGIVGDVKPWLLLYQQTLADSMDFQCVENHLELKSQPKLTICFQYS